MSIPVHKAKKPPLPELLAPAGSPAAFRAAAAAGADAIYLSGKRFGARKYAANFTGAEIEEAIRFAHSHGIRVYVTVNTLIHDRELSGAAEYLVWLYSIGVDAVLIQDAGLAALAQKLVPDLVLHASTQMTIHNAAGVRKAAEAGFQRVVLARELALDAVRAIAEETKDTGTGLEIFVHGALCYSYSGQCLLSSLIGGRSGNRGMCAQPCRKPWELLAGSTDMYGRPVNLREVTPAERYLLSPKDLCLYRMLPRITEIPVASLKIEGRMKSPEYVAIVVSTYRRALDAIAAKTFVPDEEAERDLLLAFNRGFTTGYCGGKRHRELMGRDAPDNRGLRIGTVIGYDKKTMQAEIRQDCLPLPEPGDGLLILHPDHPGETGFALNTKPVPCPGGFRLFVPGPVKAGSGVFITASRKLDARVRGMLAKPPAEFFRPVPVDLDAAVRNDGTFILAGTIERPDGMVIPVTCRPAITLAPAGSSPLSPGDLERQLKKSGGTPFVVRNLSLDFNGSWFAPVREINRLRREFFAAAEDQLVASCRPAVNDVRHARQRWQETCAAGHVPVRNIREISLPLRLAVITDAAEGVKEAAGAGADTIFFEPDLFSPVRSCGSRADIANPRDALDPALALASPAGIPLYWKFPRIVPDRFLKTAADALPGLVSRGLRGVMTDDRGAARAIHAADESFMVAGFSGLNIFNHAAAGAAAPDFSLVTLSSELSADEIAGLTTRLRCHGSLPACALVVQGSGDAMTTEDCLQTLIAPCAKEGRKQAGFLGVRDDTGALWPVRTSNACRTSIGSAKELSLLAFLPSLHRAGISEVIIDARYRTPRYVQDMTTLYRQAVNAVHARPDMKDADPVLSALLADIQKISLGGTTTGHLRHGLKE